VRSKGEKEIDFETFILNKAKADPRHKQIYRNKPQAMSELQYIQPYVQAAQQAMGGGQGREQAVGDVAVGGAALGASPDAFRQRLARTSAQKNSQGFIRGLEDQVRGIKDVLRG
jgi:hypothetical protein